MTEFELFLATITILGIVAIIAVVRRERRLNIAAELRHFNNRS
jgi:hypothetical protein